MGSLLAMALIPAAGFILLAFGLVVITRRHRNSGKPPVRGTYAWTRVILGVQVLGCALVLAGLYSGGVVEMATFSLVTLLCGLLALHREEISAWIALQAEKPLLADEDNPKTKGLSVAARRTAARFARDTALLLVVSGLANLAMEMPWNPRFANLEPMGALLEFIMVFSIITALYFVNQRRGWLAALGSTCFLFIGIAQYYMIAFKGTAIMPSDLMALGTAAAVAGTYDYSLSGMALNAITTWSVALGALSLLGPLPEPRDGVASPLARRVGTERAHGVGIVSNLMACVFFSLVFWFTCGGFGTSYYWTYGIGIDFFNTLDTYKEEGILPGFIAARQDMPIKAPANYDAEEAAQIEAELAATYEPNAEASAQFEEVRPTVIAIMNETFADLMIYPAVADAGYEGPKFYNSLQDTLARGVLYTSVEGGGTCNTEFEFLTGNAIPYIGASKYPYTLYDLSGSASLAAQFKELGYSTTAMHPNLATNWERNTVYQKFGFDRFLSIDDFEGAPVFHNGVTDAATYQRILDLLDEDGSPQFIFDVTMQNHSAYDVNNIPADQLTDYRPEGIDDDTTAQLNEYLSCIEASDRDLEWFIGELQQLDRPVILVFFGDHQPSVSKVINNALYAETDPDDLTHALRIYQSTYFVWANYDVAGNAQSGEKIDTSAGYLGALSMSLAGVPLTTYQQAQLGAAATVPAMNLLGYADTDWNWYARGSQDSPVWPTYDALNRVEYLEFGSKVQ